MHTLSTTPSAFSQAVSAIDLGDIEKLEKILDQYPRLLSERYHEPAEGYFQHPYLLWFIANNPIRHDKKLADNIVEITNMLIQRSKAQKVNDLQQQLDYALALVVSGHVAKESGVQLQLAELLISGGAKPVGAVGALAHNNLDAARFLIEKGEPVQLISAVCLGLPQADELAAKATGAEKVLALVGAAFYGMVPAIDRLISLGTDINARPDEHIAGGFHSHATALHQAVSSGSLEAVIHLVKAGARLDLTDSIYGGTPIDWAEYAASTAEGNMVIKNKQQAIAAYLRSR